MIKAQVAIAQPRQGQRHQGRTATKPRPGQRAETILGMNINRVGRPRPVGRGRLGDRSQAPRSSWDPIRRRSCWRYVSRMGGVEVEEVARVRPRRPGSAAIIDPAQGLQPRRWRRELAVDAEINRPGRRGARESSPTWLDATLIEINPLIVTNDRRVGLALEFEGDDRRQRSLPPSPSSPSSPTSRPRTRQRRMAKEKGLTYVKLSSNMRILGNGAGLCTVDGSERGSFRPAASQRTSSTPAAARRPTQSFGVIASNRERQRDPVQRLRRRRPQRPDHQGDHRGLAAGCAGSEMQVVVRLEGTTSAEGLGILAEWGWATCT